jgi:hypothetical protein
MGEATPASEPLVIAFVLAASHSGSTLLSLLLNAHSRVHALSEIDKIGLHARNPDRGRRPLRSPFWRDVAARYDAAGARKLAQIELRAPRESRLEGRELAAWAIEYGRLAEAVAAVSGKRILVDASKDAAQLDLLLRAERFDVRVIALVRDGRGVAHSAARKTGSFARGLRHWARSQRSAAALRARVAPERWHSVRYEDLARAPEATLRSVCVWLGVAYEPGMLAYRRAAWEGISGNRVATRSDEKIALDERWRRELLWRHRALFALVGARLNARNGY